jgi:hypothetical protein
MLRSGSLIKFLLPAAVGMLGLYTSWTFLGNWAYPHIFFLGFVIAVWIAVVSGASRIRDGATVFAAILLCLAAMETYALFKQGAAVDRHSTRLTRLDPVLGWGPRPGILHQTKYDLKTGNIVADADYTIEPRGIRKTISAPDAPTVAFFGDSMTFGEGLADSETLPQLFADLSDRRLHVLNLAFSAYGPQQFLRALETDLFKDLLNKPRLFVYMTAQWHAERTACMHGFVFLGPRYELADGHPQFEGPCHGLIYGLLARSAIYKAFIEPAMVRIGPGEIDLYVAILIRAGELARQKYGVPTAILYLPDPIYAGQSGWPDEQIMQRLRQGGLNVIDIGLDQRDFPGQPLEIPSDGHPTGVANLARAKLLYSALGDIAAPSAQISSISAPAGASPCAGTAKRPSALAAAAFSSSTFQCW